MVRKAQVRPVDQSIFQYQLDICEGYREVIILLFYVNDYLIFSSYKYQIDAVYKFFTIISQD